MDPSRHPRPDLLLDVLLALPAADRLELADILRRSVGWPANADVLELPGWQRDHQDRLLHQGEPGPQAPPESRAKKSPAEAGLFVGT